MTRAILSALLVLVLPAAARADVFVPADPPVAAAHCIAGARDVLALGLDDGEVAVGGQLLPGLDLCPVVAAAADGTAAIASSTTPGAAARMSVRRPGGAFAEPVMLAPAGATVRVAAAPGGWSAAVWSGTHGLRARVFASDGTSRAALLDHGPLEYSGPRIGIDASGRATAVWTAWDATSGRYALRVARSAGTAWTPSSTLATGRRVLNIYPAEAQADVAVTPSGHTLLAWAPGDGIRATLDGAPLTIARARRAGSPAVALTDAGAALVAYGVPSGRVMVSDRAAGGAFAAPHAAGSAIVVTGGGPALTRVDVVLGDDGRAVAAWEAGPLGRLTAAAGVAGGVWSPAAGLSSPARGAEAPSLTLDATGAPWLLWTETASGLSRLPARGARLVAGAPALDRTPPGLVTSLPGRTRLVRGLVRIRVPVTCSEACDARLSLVWRGVELGAAVRALPAGRRGLLTARLYVPKRTLRVQVLVADRAGNWTRRSRVLRVSR